MKIKITQTVEVDPASWVLEFGLNQNSEQSDAYAVVRQDVKSYLEGRLQGHIANLGLDPK